MISKILKESVSNGGLTVSKICNILGIVRPASVSAFISGKRNNINIEKLEKLFIYFNILKVNKKGMLTTNEELYDERGVGVFVGRSEVTGKFSVQCYRKKTKSETKGDLDYKMIPVYHTTFYLTRKEAIKASLELAEKVCIEFGF